MAKIVHSDLAPEGKITYNIGQVTFDLTASGSYESDDPAVISSALSHPWLKVEYDKATVIEPHFRSVGVPPADDALAGVNSVAFDPKEIQKALDAAAEVEVAQTAIDAGEDQGEVIVEGGVAQTLAADKEAAKSGTTPQEKN